ncbi:phosphate acyltransferase PlsX [Lederbergia galactosidilytica]|uniref:Phosphate acyltransferase n=1 Tax=Lederbergia galactosidilytica TaxID=217031 RepID=A0A177ZXC4_9BACI|nr:phosphate acyltransferase PlsX [Lederbergia galactosidilytica]KRG13508.1 phosphate acyltransferase [Virgibacillus soli]MBP1913690.1 glycerol-3-phosphate acyltransferase PlsX [Lederbergia galactosidilytica]OAK72586.1 phosphate acyltransferase [Lederbergia galactosidilytica]
MRIAIDAMGGDHAPKEIILGVNRAIEEFTDIECTLFGNEEEINKYVEKNDRIAIVHTDEKIESTDEPVKAVRRKKTASMVMMAQAVKDKTADACISAGNTGALMAAGLFIVGRIKGIERPALAPTLPTLDGKGFVFLDVGANADAKPEHLLQYATMGSIYAQNVRKIANPKVALLNIGTEENKGNDLTKKAFTLLQDSELNFIGNIESRDLLTGSADVIVTDGFTGNVVLKNIEGTAASLFSMLKDTFMNSFKNKIAAGLIKSDLLEIKNKMDYTEYGGACLFGLNAPVVKAHGSSNANAIYHAIRQTREMVHHHISETIANSLKLDNE